MGGAHSAQFDLAAQGPCDGPFPPGHWKSKSCTLQGSAESAQLSCLNLSKNCIRLVVPHAMSSSSRKKSLEHQPRPKPLLWGAHEAKNAVQVRTLRATSASTPNARLLFHIVGASRGISAKQKHEQPLEGYGCIYMFYRSAPMYHPCRTCQTCFKRPRNPTARPMRSILARHRLGTRLVGPILGTRNPWLKWKIPLPTMSLGQ